jgi:hypothetical protein
VDQASPVQREKNDPRSPRQEIRMSDEATTTELEQVKRRQLNPRQITTALNLLDQNCAKGEDGTAVYADGKSDQSIAELLVHQLQYAEEHVPFFRRAVGRLRLQEYGKLKYATSDATQQIEALEKEYSHLTDQLNILAVAVTDLRGDLLTHTEGCLAAADAAREYTSKLGERVAHLEGAWDVASKVGNGGEVATSDPTQ